MNKGFIGRVPTALQLFMILPFAHSENVDDQELSLSLHKAFEPEGADRARRHWRIVKRFGRFPHRNGILGRTMTVEERRYLENGGFSG